MNVYNARFVSTSTILYSTIIIIIGLFSCRSLPIILSGAEAGLHCSQRGAALLHLIGRSTISSTHTCGDLISRKFSRALPERGIPVSFGGDRQRCFEISSRSSLKYPLFSVSTADRHPRSRARPAHSKKR